MFVGVFSPKTTTADSFVQSLLRVRQYAEHEHILHMYEGKEDANLSDVVPMMHFRTFIEGKPNKATLLVDQQVQLDQVIQARYTQLRKFGRMYVISALTHLGFELYRKNRVVYCDEKYKLGDEPIDFNTVQLDYDWVYRHIITAKKAKFTTVSNNTATLFDVAWSIVQMGY